MSIKKEAFSRLAILRGVGAEALGVGAFGLPGIDGIAMEAVFAIFFLLLLAAFFLFFAFLAAIAHGKKLLGETSVREWRVDETSEFVSAERISRMWKFRFWF